jgi:hypothetical protein
MQLLSCFRLACKVRTILHKMVLFDGNLGSLYKFHEFNLLESHFEIDFFRFKVIICRLFGLKNRLYNRLFYEKIRLFFTALRHIQSRHLLV